MLNKETRDIAKKIGEYYLSKHGGNYADATEAILNLRITRLECVGNKVTIHLGRPGLLIGKRGKRHLRRFFED